MGRFSLVRLSLANRLALVFTAITFLAIGTLYLYVAPGLESRLVSDQLHSLASDARRLSGPIAATVGGAQTRSEIASLVGTAALTSGARVTLLSVSEAVSPGGPQLTTLADSSTRSAARALGPAVARQAVDRGALVTGTERVGGDTLAEAAMPVPYAGRIARIVLFSVSVSSVAHNVSTVRHEILVAGGIALLLALIGSYVLARALALRVKRLERAARQMAAGDFSASIPPGGSDELGQLARAFNDMQRQLRQLDEARKRFIATASHELRTPIFSLGGFVELLEDEDLDPETRRRFLEQVRDQVERLRKLSVDLLDLSRLESGSLELRPEGVDLAELARSVSGEFEPTLAAQDGHLELRLQSRRVEAFCDPVRVAQILRILLDNALTHTGEGTHVTVTAGRNDGHVRLAVRDDGEGIAPDAAARIFEPFYTGHGTRGSGLGLAIASELAGRMAADLQVRSRPGETVFTLELPG
jgi:signal transduction histidine kinase